jgi:hypothetical protein
MLSLRSRREILRAHYARLFRKSALWVGLVSLIASMFVSLPAFAYGQITTRSVTLGTSAAATSTTYTFTFKPATSEPALTAVAFSLCDVPWEVTSTCAQSVGALNASLASATLVTSAPTTAPFTSGFSIGTGANCGTATSTKNICFYDATGVSVVAGTSYTIQITGVLNPSPINSTFYANMFMATTASTVYSAPTDFGAMAAATGQTLTVQATVQEALTFCVGVTVNTTGTACTTVGGATIPLGTSAPCPIMSYTYTCTGTSMMDANTNATNGYTISYNGSTFLNSSAAHTIPAIGSTVASSAIGTEQFGLAGTNFQGTGSGLFNTTGTNYCFTNGTGCVTGNGSKYAYVTGSAQTFAAATGPTTDNQYTTTYVGNVSTTTNPGLYQATINYTATGSF